MQFILYVLVLIAGGAIGFGGYYFQNKKELEKISKEKLGMVDEAKKITAEAERKAKDLLNEANKEINKKQQKLEAQEEKLFEKHEKLDAKLESIEDEKEKVKKKQEELQQIIEEGRKKLSEISGLSQEEAKARLLDMVEKENKEDIVKFIQKFKQIKELEAEEVSGHIISQVLPKVGVDTVSEFTVTDIILPSEDIKGKIIGREGRNISFFERVTGAELIIDDTPMTVRLSCFDPEKRFLAAETLNRLIKDGRINPVYVEKTYTEVKTNLESLLKKKGEESLAKLNLPMMNPDVLTLIGKFHLRYSYGQNLLLHCMEVAKISEAIANELGLDGVLAKKAGLLHDIGKVIDSNLNAHAKVGAEALKKFGFNDTIVNAAESHHYDVPLKGPISRIVTAADAMSAARPGARLNTKEIFVERMENLEKLITGIDGVDKTYIMQAGREILAFVNPAIISDLDLEKLVKNIGKTIEVQLDYPGVIRVVAIRETKHIDYLT